jgi:hypothetical protein
LLGYGTAAAAGTAPEAAASFFSIFSAWLVLLRDVLSSCDAESDIMSGENCESKVFAERKIDERLVDTFFLPQVWPGISMICERCSGLFVVGPPIRWNVADFWKPCRFSVFKLHFLCRTPRSLRSLNQANSSIRPPARFAF